MVQQAVLQKLRPDEDDREDGRMTHVALILLINVVLSSLLHIAAMYAGKLFNEMKQKIKIQETLLDKIEEGVIVTSVDMTRIIYANKTAQQYLRAWNSAEQTDQFDFKQVDLSKIILEKVDTDCLIESDCSLNDDPKLSEMSDVARLS